MIQVKYNDQKWWVLLNGSLVEIAEKDWEKIKKLCWYVLAWYKPEYGIRFQNWQPSPDQIYSLPNEVEFEITRDCKFNDGLCEYDKVACKCKKVAHLKESEPKKEEFRCSHGCEAPYSECLNQGDYKNCTFYGKVERSEEVRKEPTYKQGWNDALSNIQNKIRLMFPDDGEDIGSTISQLEDYIFGEKFVIKQSISKDSQSEIESLREQVKVWKQHCETARNSDDLNTTLLFKQGFKIKELESKLVQLTTLKELSENLLEIMVTDLRSRPDKPFMASSTKSYTTHELAIEFSKRTPEGIGFLNDVIQLTIDRISRDKEKLSPKEEEPISGSDSPQERKQNQS